MAWKDARKLIDARRERVAQLHLRGLTQREIVAALEQQGMVNPETGKPYGKTIICKDLNALNKQWQKDAARAISDHKSDQAAEIKEVIRAAWAAKELTTVMRALERQAKLFGLDAPMKVAPTDPTGAKEYSGVTDDELRRLVQAIMGETGEQR